MSPEKSKIPDIPKQSYRTQLLKAIVNRADHVVVRLPRGFGKTSFLHSLRDAFEIGRVIAVERSADSVDRMPHSILAGSATAEARDCLTELEQSPTLPSRGGAVLLIDDFDDFCSVGITKMEDLNARYLAFRNVMNALSKVNGRIIATSSKPKDSIVTRTHEMSYLIQERMEEEAGTTLTVKEIKSAFDIDISAMALRASDSASVDIDGVFVERDDRLLNAWIAQTDESTGGHPTLVASAIRSYLGLMATVSSAPHPTPLSLTRATSIIRRYIEREVSRDGLRSIRRLLNGAQEFPDGEWAAALVLLQRFAKTREVQENSSGAIQLLEDSGLIASTNEGRTYSAIGALIRRELRERFDPNAIESGEISLLRDTQFEDRGRAITVLSDGPKEIELSGVGWRMLDYLASVNGRTVSQEELENYLGINGTALTPALQRLRLRLGELERRDLIQNVRGEGYRIDPADLK